MNRLSQDDLISRLRNISLPKEKAPKPRVASTLVAPEASSSLPEFFGNEKQSLASSRSIDSFGDPRRDPAPAILLGRKMSASRVNERLGDKVTPRRAKRLGRQLPRQREPAKRRDILRMKQTAGDVLDGFKSKYSFNDSLEYMEAAQTFVKSTEVLRGTDARKAMSIPEVEASVDLTTDGQEIDQTSAALQQSVDPSISSGKSPYIPSHFSHGGAHSLASTKSSERRKDPNSQEHPPFFFHRIDQGEKDKEGLFPEVKSNTLELTRPKTPEEVFVNEMLHGATARHAASTGLVSGVISDALGNVRLDAMSQSTTIESATSGFKSPTIPPLGGFLSSSDDEDRLGINSDAEQSYGAGEPQRQQTDIMLAAYSERARRRRKQERQRAARDAKNYFNRPKEESLWDYDNNGYLWTHEQEEEDRRQPGYRSIAQKAASKREYDMEHTYRMKGKGGPAINDAGALSSAARQKSIIRGDLRTGSVPNVRSGEEKTRRRRRRLEDSRQALPSVAVDQSMRTLDDQLDELFARDSDRMDRSGRLADEHYILKAHEQDLMRRGYLQRRRERGDQLKNLNKIEAITRSLPMAFLVEKGIGDLTVQHSFNIMVNVVNRALNAEIKAAWNVWVKFVNALNRAEFIARANRFQQEEGLNMLKRVMRRMLRARIGHRFHTWLSNAQKMRDVFTRALQEKKAIVIQRNFRIYLAHQRGVAFFKKIVRKKKQQAIDMANLSAWIHNRSRMIGRHRRNKARRSQEDKAAHIIIKNFRTKQGVKHLIKRIKATAARKAAELQALRTKSANTIQRWAHWYRCWYWPLEVRFRNRKRLLRMIKLGLITQAEASASSASDGEGEAEVIVDYELPAIEIQRAYRRHLQWHALINRFPRRKQLIEAELFSAHLHAMAQRAQRMYRAYKLRHFLRNRITARLFVNYRLIQPTLIRSAAAVLIQIPLRNVMCREKLNFIFAARKVLMEAQYEKDLLEAAIKVQQAWRKSQGRYSEFILARARAAKAAARAAMEEEKRKRDLYLRAVLKMQRNYRLSNGRFNLAQRFTDRRRQIAEQRHADRRERAVRSIQKQWRVHRGRTGLNLQIQARLFKTKMDAQLAAEKNAAFMISRSGRRKCDWKRLENRFERRKTLERVQKEREMRHAKANVIIKAWHDCNWRFNQPVRIASRITSVKKVREARRKRQWELEDKSARYIQRSWIHRRSRILLQEMFNRRAEILAKARRYKLENDMAKIIGFSVRKYQDKERVRLRTQYRRIQIAAQRLFDHRSLAARKIQQCYHKYRNRLMLWRKFEARRNELEAQDLQQRRVLEAKIAAQQARDAQDAARAALKQMEFAGWKMGADDHGRNYYYNLITGETQFEKPEGWVPPQEELWVKNTTITGLTYYYNQMSGETAWFPPCDECHQNEGKKICFDCPGTYCPGCFNKKHYPCCDPEKVDSSVQPPHDGCVVDAFGKKMCEHLWKGADQDKEELGFGEIHCQKCQTKKAVRTSKLSRESFCLECYLELHNTPWTSQIEWIPYEEFKKGWQEVKGRNPGDSDYYFNPMTREETHNKPMDLMNPDEKREHIKFKQYEKAAGKYVKKIDRLQHHIETLEYEKDTAFFEQQKKATLEQEELETLRELLSLREEKQKKVSWLSVLKNPLKYQLDKWKREKRERALYRKQLLLSKKQKAEQAKREAAEMVGNAGGDGGGPENGSESRPTSPEASG